eukprot:5068574-Prymnesium_polylepis.2
MARGRNNTVVCGQCPLTCAHVPINDQAIKKLVVPPLFCIVEMATITADCNPGEDIVVSALAAQGFFGVQRKRLPVGDYQVSHGKSVVLIERKTLDDWRSSMIDG